MQPRYRIYLLALIALGWSSIASAANPAPTSTVEPSTIPTISNFSLDDAFELATSPKREPALRTLAGPTRMDCASDAVLDDVETCVVTTSGHFASMPATMAPN